MDDEQRFQKIVGLLRERGREWSKTISRDLGIPWEDVVDTIRRHQDCFHACGHSHDEAMSQTCWTLKENALTTLSEFFTSLGGSS